MTSFSLNGDLAKSVCITEVKPVHNHLHHKIIPLHPGIYGEVINSALTKAKFGPEMQNTLVMIPIILQGWLTLAFKVKYNLKVQI